MSYAQPHQWPAHQEETLRKLWAEGKSASQIAKALGNVRSRNSVIGKIHRLGIQRTGDNARRGPDKNKVRSARVKRQAVRTAPAVKKAKPVALPVDLAFVAAIPPADVQFADVTGCRYMPGDPQIDARVCNRPTVCGAWCVEHRKLVYVPVRARVVTPLALELARIKREIRQAGRSL